MSLSDTVLGAAIKAEIITEFGTPADAAQLEKFSNAIARAVVAHITANAVVSVTGVTVGAGSASGTVS